jgi:hexosaminidase
MRQFIILLLVLFLIKPTIAQHVFPVKDISIHWETVENDYQNKPQSRNAVIITNNSTSEFPGTGWKMYFNSARLIVPAAVSGNASLHLINGDLFSLTPSTNFPSLKPRASVRIELIAEEPS